VVGGCLVLAALLLRDTPVGDGLLGDGQLVAPLVGDRTAPAVTGAVAFDPDGDGTENDGDARLAVDGDPSTAWRTERYETRDFGNLKDGVGIAATLDRSTPLRALRVRSPSTGWAARVYVADDVGGSLPAWGEPVAGASGLEGDATFDLGGVEGRAVLLWITDLGNGPGRVEIAELVPVP
jgi:hypothetical protein